MIRGIGMDAVEIDRIRISRERYGKALVEKLLGPRERKALVRSQAPDEFLAGRFAAKEAVMKALGTGWAAGIRFPDIEVVANRAGAPSVHLSGQASTRSKEMKIRHFFITITHTKSLAMALAVAE